MSRVALSGSSFYEYNGMDPTDIVVMCHGYGASGSGMIGLAGEFGGIFERPYFIAPNAPFHYEFSAAPSGDEYQWYSLLSRDRDDLLEGSENARPFLDDFLDDLLRKFGLTGKNLYLVGFSQGTMISLHTAIRRSNNPPRAIVGFSGTVVAPENVSSDSKSSPRVCLVHGSDDEIVSVSLGRLAHNCLLKAGIESSFYAIPGLAHSIDSMAIKIARDFLAGVSQG